MEREWLLFSPTTGQPLPLSLRLDRWGDSTLLSHLGSNCWTDYRTQERTLGTPLQGRRELEMQVWGWKGAVRFPPLPLPIPPSPRAELGLISSL